MRNLFRISGRQDKAPDADVEASRYRHSGEKPFDGGTLLQRKPRNINLGAAIRLVRGKRILITGAGGTIGSELSRQVLSFGPSTLVLVDNAEYNLYKIDQEITGLNDRSDGAVTVISRLADVCRQRHMEAIFDGHAPEIVIHAAAFKHVPIVEENRCAGALSNVLGAQTVFDLAHRYGSEAVVFISSDKAVNPTSFMGATKRIAELYAQALDVAQSTTRFVTVRFGNVIGSTGSVVPLFQKQIEQGGPLTITHPDISRYFMTTSEAVKLVLQAASLGHNERGIVTHDGRIFVLDMGEPVSILELANRMAGAYGMKLGTDIEVRYTGLRPGEKLFEEIFHESERLISTGADGVLLASPTMIDLPLLMPRLKEVTQAAEEYDVARLVTSISHLVPEFSEDVNNCPARNPAQGSARPVQKA